MSRITDGLGLSGSHEVFVVVDGAIDCPRFYSDAAHALEGAAEEAYRLSYRNGTGSWAVLPWEVFVLPHYCGGEADCECAQWLLDHRPVYSSEFYSRPAMGEVRS